MTLEDEMGLDELAVDTNPETTAIDGVCDANRDSYLQGIIIENESFRRNESRVHVLLSPIELQDGDSSRSL